MKVQLKTTGVVALFMLCLIWMGAAGCQAENSGQETGSGKALQPSPERTAAICIDDGIYRADQSSVSAVQEGKITDSSASGVKITSKADDFTGLYVRGGKSVFTLSDAAIDLSGNGSREASEVGAMVDEGGILILKNVKITTSGLRTPSIAVQNHSVLKVFDSTIRTNGGTPPAGVEFPESGPTALGPAGPLGLGGNARNTLVTSQSQAFFYHSTIISDSWGALSTDYAGGSAYIEANDCDIQTLHDGYGTYADNDTNVVINNSRMKNGLYTAIVEGIASLTLNNVDAVSGRYTVLVHDIFGGPKESAVVKISGGRLESEKTALLIESANVNIFLDAAALVAGNGILVHSEVNQDPNANMENGTNGIHIAMTDENLEGDVLHEDTGRGMTLTFVNSKLKGTVKNAVLVLDAGSKWTATGDSEVTLSGATDVTHIDAPAGVAISATAQNGCTLSGSYKLASGGILHVNTPN